MKRILFLITASVAIFSCSDKPKDSYTIQGDITGLKSEKIYLAYENGDTYQTDSTTVENGKFSFEGKMPEPAIAYLQTPEGEGVSFMIENADISISGHIDSLGAAVVKGGAVQKEYEDFEVSVKDLVQSQKSIYEASMAAREKGVEKGFEEQMGKMQDLNQSLMAKNKKYIEEHPASYVSLILLQSISEGMPLTDLENLYEGLDKEYQAKAAGKKIAGKIETVKKTAVGETAMDFTQNDLEGKPVKLSDFKGKYVLLDFWASWCVPCRAENPNVLKAYNQYKDKNFTVLTVSLDMNDQDWRDAIKEEGMPWTQLSDLMGGENEVAKMYGITGIPASFLIDPDGVIIARDLRGEELSSKLAEVLN